MHLQINEDDFSDHYDESEDENKEFNIRRKKLRDKSNPFKISPRKFKRFYRLSQEQVLKLINLIGHHVSPKNEKGIPVHLRVLICLEFFSSRSYQWTISQNFLHPVSPPSVCRFLDLFVNALQHIYPLFIRFPWGKSSRKLTAQKFYAISGLKNILSIIDGTFIKIKRPIRNEEAFISYHKGHGINCQATVDSDGLVTSLKMAPGSNNDQFIWNQSRVKKMMQSLYMDEEILENEGTYYLLGDKGYAVTPVMLQPITEADRGTPEYLFTKKVCSLRSKVENVFGEVKEVIRCLNKDGQLNYEPAKAKLIIKAGFLLNNFRKLNGNPLETEEIDFEIKENIHFPYDLGLQERERYIKKYINN